MGDYTEGSGLGGVIRRDRALKDAGHKLYDPETYGTNRGDRLTEDEATQLGINATRLA